MDTLFAVLLIGVWLVELALEVTPAYCDAPVTRASLKATPNSRTFLVWVIPPHEAESDEGDKMQAGLWLESLLPRLIRLLIPQITLGV